MKKFPVNVRLQVRLLTLISMTVTILANLSHLHLRLGHRQIFADASLTISEGDKIGVLGLNGHGKSTLFKILTEQISADTSSPAFIYDKNSELSIFHIPQRLPEENSEYSAPDYFFVFYPEFLELKTQIEAINAQLSSEVSDELLSKQQRLFDKWQHHKIDQIHAQFLSHLKNLNFMEFELPFHKLSGGEKRKIALALGLSSQAKLILWDEPTNHLDLKTIEVFEEQLSKSQKTFLLISHDRELLSQVSNRIIHIHHQNIESFQGSYHDYLEFLKAEQASQQKAADRIQNRLRRETAWIRQGVKARTTRSKKRVENYHDLKDRLEKLKSLKQKSMSLSIEQDKVKTKQLVKANQLKIEFDNKLIFEQTDFIISNQSKIALLGDNGSGKSTLVKAILNQIPFQGDIKIKDDLLITYFDQHLDLPNETITPYEYIGEGKEMLTLPSGRSLHIFSYLDDFLFSPEEAKRPMSHFSGGERKRLQLAKFLLKPSHLMIFDEPSNDLDLESIGILEEELSKFQGPIILITHDRELIRNSTNLCWVIENQQLQYFTAGFEQWLTQKELEKAQSSMQEVAETSSSRETEEKPKKKLTNKEKMRLKQLPSEIEEMEMEVLELEEQIEAYDYSSGDFEGISKLTKQLEDSNQQLQKLYSEKEKYDKY